MRCFLSLFAVAIISLTVLSACNSADWGNAGRTSGIPTLTPAADGARRISIPELKVMLEKNEAVAIDVRNQASYNIAHIKGAKLIPEADVVSRRDELPKNKLIVTYCS